MPNTNLRVLALVPNAFDTSPGQRFRIEQWEPFLAADGIEIEYAPFEANERQGLLHGDLTTAGKVRLLASAVKDRLRRLRADLPRVDLVYIFRESSLIGPAAIERWLRRAGIPYVFDFDDAVFLRYKSPSNGWFSILRMPGKTATSCRLASQVLAGNPHLESYAKRFNDHVTVVPTTINTALYRPSPGRRSSEPIVVGWSGSFSTAQHLATAMPALRELAQSLPYTLRVVGTPTFEAAGVSVEALPWRSATELDDLRPMDIGIMPLPDDRWSQGKCGLKALQYMALGIPTVCSPVGVNVDIIDDGVNGFLADTTREWVDVLSRLANDADLRARVGAAGRRTVEDHFNGEVWAHEVARIFRKAVSGSHHNARQ